MQLWHPVPPPPGRASRRYPGLPRPGRALANWGQVRFPSTFHAGPTDREAKSNLTLFAICYLQQLIAKIDHFVAHHNQNCKPFVWTATADSILAKLQRLCQQISGTRH